MADYLFNVEKGGIRVFDSGLEIQKDGKEKLTHAHEYDSRGNNEDKREEFCDSKQILNSCRPSNAKSVDESEYYYNENMRKIWEMHRNITKTWET